MIWNRAKKVAIEDEHKQEFGNFLDIGVVEVALTMAWQCCALVYVSLVSCECSAAQLATHQGQARPGPHTAIRGCPKCGQLVGLER